MSVAFVVRYDFVIKITFSTFCSSWRVLKIKDVFICRKRGTTTTVDTHVTICASTWSIRLLSSSRGRYSCLTSLSWNWNWHSLTTFTISVIYAMDTVRVSQFTCNTFLCDIYAITLNDSSHVRIYPCKKYSVDVLQTLTWLGVSSITPRILDCIKIRYEIISVNVY